jgi:hypothetical protein
MMKQTRRFPINPIVAMHENIVIRAISSVANIFHVFLGFHEEKKENIVRLPEVLLPINEINNYKLTLHFNDTTAGCSISVSFLSHSFVKQNLTTP